MLCEALEAARAIGDEEDRLEALAALAPHLTEPWLREALEAARAAAREGPSATRYKSEQCAPLAELAPRLAELGHPAEALEAARAVPPEYVRIWVLAALAPRLAELGHPAEALEAARAIGDERYRSQALAALAPHLTEPWLREALEAARVIKDEGDLSRALATLAPRLVELSRPQKVL